MRPTCCILTDLNYDPIGPISSALVNRFGSRPIVMLGGLMCGVSMVAASFGNSIIILYACIGVIGGLLVDVYGDYKYLFLMCGGVTVTGGVFLFVMNIYHYHMLEKEKQTRTSTEDKEQANDRDRAK